MNPHAVPGPKAPLQFLPHTPWHTSPPSLAVCRPSQHTSSLICRLAPRSSRHVTISQKATGPNPAPPSPFGPLGQGRDGTGPTRPPSCWYPLFLPHVLPRFPVFPLPSSPLVHASSCVSHRRIIRGLSFGLPVRSRKAFPEKRPARSTFRAKLLTHDSRDTHTSCSLEKRTAEIHFAIPQSST